METMKINYENPDEILDIGKTLKKEKIIKENEEKIEKLKEEYKKEQEEEQEKQEQEKEEKKISVTSFNFTKYKTLIFLIIILLFATSLRFYISSMPLTYDWAEQVVKDDLEKQVKNKIYQEYPTLSEEKKSELVQQGTYQAFASPQNQEAIKSLARTYKESYKDSSGNIYLYEIDPYFFYEIAKSNYSVLLDYPKPALPLVERWFYKTLNMVFPDISFIGAIFYIPLIFINLSAIVLFFIIKEIWDETAGFLGALFFVVHPIVLEFSMLGFVDTNMLNLFFILITGLFFILSIRFLKQKLLKQEQKNIKDYCVTFFKAILIAILIFSLIISFIIAFKYTWSGWYSSVFLIVMPLYCFITLFLFKRVYYWKEQKHNVRFMLVIGLFLFLAINSFLVYYATQEVKVENQYEMRLVKYIPEEIKKYLHIEHLDPYGIWPEAFSLIKELQQTTASNLVDFLGGKIYVLISIIVFLFLVYKIIKTNEITAEINYIYLVIAYLFFGILSLRAIRLLPYFIPFFATTVGVGISILLSFFNKKLQHYLDKEKKSFRIVSLAIVYSIIFIAFAYPILPQIQERSKIMPIMDDAIYNSAIFIEENSNINAIISTWWDRGTFYKALAEREVHLHSQPHMPKTYWLASFYNTNNEIQAKNIVSMINCEAEPDVFSYFNVFFSKENYTNEKAREKSIDSMKQILSYDNNDGNNNNSNQSITHFYEMFMPLNYSNYIIYNSDYSKIEELYNIISYKLSCDKANAETYIVIIDDLMPRFSAVQYFAAWDFKADAPDNKYPYTDIEEGGCSRSQTGIYCTIGRNQFFLNFTSLNVSATAPVNEVYLVANNTVQYNVLSGLTENSETNQETRQTTLLVYQRAGYWKALYLPKQVADSMYVKLMILDGYNLTYFEKVFDEVHVETAWVKVYKIKLGMVEE